jgi:RimJ/RimL family protein N-acetyltransferase
LRERYRRLEKRRSPDGTALWLNWAVVSGVTAVGFVQATVAVDLSEAEIAYVIGMPFWSSGIGTEAVRLLLEFLREQLHIRNAVATVDNRNVRSLRLLRRLGFLTTDDSDPENVRLALPLVS